MLTVQGIPDEHVTNAEAAALTPVCVLGALVVGAWAGDLAGLPVSPVAAVPLAACVGVPCLVALWRGARPDPGGLVAWGAVTVATLALLLRWAWPSLLPLAAALAMNTEVRRPALVHAEEPQHLPHLQHRKVYVGAEAPVPHQQVAFAQQRVQLPDLRLLVEQ